MSATTERPEGLQAGNPVLRLLRTVRHLRPSQILWRLRYAAERRLLGGQGFLRRSLHRSSQKMPPLREDFPELPLSLPAPSQRGTTVSLLDRGVLELLNQPRAIGRESPDWRLGDPANERLRTITLHYHEWVYALAEKSVDPGESQRARMHAATLFRHYVGDWIRRCARNCPGARHLAWNSYAIATRLEWWIRSYQLAYGPVFAPAPAFEETFRRSLWEQASHLSGHLEWDLRANHLLRDLLGLALAGRFFRGRRGATWLRRASALTLAQLDEQVLPDGGHFERSPMYHVEAMHDLSLLHALLEGPGVRSSIAKVYGKMVHALQRMRHPDGDLVQFNDCALRGGTGVDRVLESSEHLVLGAASSRVEPGADHLPDTGLVRWLGRPWAVFFDVGPVGPSVQPGHAHADSLTVECSFNDKRLIVDPGTYGYDLDERRRYDRSTESHNTVSIDGENSSEVWHVFRVGRRAHPIDVEVQMAPDRLVATASHDGFDHLPGCPRHLRTLRLEDPMELNVIDRILGGGRHCVEGGFLVHPRWQAQATADGWLLRSAEGTVRVICRASAPLRRFHEARPYHPSNGVELEATRLGWRWQGEPPLEVRTILSGV